MANRSYLYTSDIIPKDGSQIKNLQGVSEWRYDIPLVHLMLISASTELCKSSIWESSEKTALVGDRAQGILNLLKLLRLVENSSPNNLYKLKIESEYALDFLLRFHPSQKYMLLEPGEVFDLDEGMIEEAAQSLLQDSQRMLEAVENFDIETLNEYAKVDIRTEWEERLGLYWSDVLYFQFNEPPQSKAPTKPEITQSFDLKGKQLTKIFFKPQIQVIESSGGRELPATWAGRVLPGQTFEEGIATELHDVYGYTGRFNYHSVYFLDYTKHSEGQDIKRYGVYITLLDRLEPKKMTRLGRV